MANEKQIFIPVPVPGVAGTMVQSHIEKLSDLGVYGSRSIRVWASRFDWGSQDAKGLFPEEGKGVKLWQHTALVGRDDAPEKQDYVFVSAKPFAIQLTESGDKKGFSHPSFNIYSQEAGRLYRDYLPLFQQWGGVPRLVWTEIDKAEALRINVSEGLSCPIPLAHWLDEAKTIHTFPSNMALRFNPVTGVVEAFLLADFVKEFGNPAQYYTQTPIAGVNAPFSTVAGVVVPVAPRTPAPAVDSIIASRTINADSGMYITSEGELITRVEDEMGERQAVATGFMFHTESGKFGDGGGWAGNYPDNSTCVRVLEILRPEILAQGGKDAKITIYGVSQVQAQPVIRCTGPDGGPREFNIHNTITAIAGKILLRKGELVYAWGPTIRDMVATAFGGG